MKTAKGRPEASNTRYWAEKKKKIHKVYNIHSKIERYTEEYFSL